MSLEIICPSFYLNWKLWQETAANVWAKEETVRIVEKERGEEAGEAEKEKEIKK